MKSIGYLWNLFEDAKNERQYPSNNSEHQFQERNQDTTSQNSYYYTNQEPKHISKNYDVMPTPLTSVSASSHHSFLNDSAKIHVFSDLRR